MKSIRTTLASCTALAMLACTLTVTTVGCTPAQKQTTLQIITEINAKLPEIQAGADTVAATIAALAPADAVLINTCDVGFDTLATTLKALTAAYIANPNATTLQQIQTAINTLEGSINTAVLNTVGIKDATSQKLAVAALKGFLTSVTIVFGLISATESVAMLYQLRETNTIHLARVRPYMDEHELQQAAKDSGVDLDAAFAQAERAGF